MLTESWSWVGAAKRVRKAVSVCFEKLLQPGLLSTPSPKSLPSGVSGVALLDGAL